MYPRSVDWSFCTKTHTHRGIIDNEQRSVLWWRVWGWGEKREDSTWTITYRFSSQPKDDDTNDNNSNSNDGKNQAVIPTTFYSGKMTVLFQEDGYSKLISTEEGGKKKIKIQKVWGWDEETSQEKMEEKYLLFSMDVQFPESEIPEESSSQQSGRSFFGGSSSRMTASSTTERIYFQARIDRDDDKSKSGGSGSSALSLSDGTITIKKDISEKTRGMWGLFQVAGILSQFRYVGDFIAKPTSTSTSTTSASASSTSSSS